MQRGWAGTTSEKRTIRTLVSEGAEHRRVKLLRNFWKPGVRVMNAFGWCMHTQRPEYDFRCLPFDVGQNAFCQGFSVSQNWSFRLGWLASMLSGCPSLYLPMPALQVHAAGPDFLYECCGFGRRSLYLHKSSQQTRQSLTVTKRCVYWCKEGK